jgi:hypothetical protein
MDVAFSAIESARLYAAIASGLGRYSELETPKFIPLDCDPPPPFEPITKFLLN